MVATLVADLLAPGPSLTVLSKYCQTEAPSADHPSGQTDKSLIRSCPLPDGSFTWDLHGLISRLDAQGFLPDRSSPSAFVETKECAQ